MFYGCSSIKDITPKKVLGIEYKDNIEGIFWCCSNIKTKLSFSDWGSTLDRYNQMFYDISKEK